MGFTSIPDRSAGYALAEADWDAIKDNFNSGTWVLLASTNLSGTSATIDYSAISSSYAHLMLTAYLRGANSSGSVSVRARFNNDSGNNYDWQDYSGFGAIGSPSEVFGTSFALVGSCPAALAPANVFGSVKMIVPHYTNSANNKAAMARYSNKTGTGSGNVTVGTTAGFWRSNSAINRITLFPSAGSFAAGCRVSLFGLA